MTTAGGLGINPLETSGAGAEATVPSTAPQESSSPLRRITILRYRIEPIRQPTALSLPAGRCGRGQAGRTWWLCAAIVDRLTFAGEIIETPDSWTKTFTDPRGSAGFHYGGFSLCRDTAAAPAGSCQVTPRRRPTFGVSFGSNRTVGRWAAPIIATISSICDNFGCRRTFALSTRNG